MKLVATVLFSSVAATLSAAGQEAMQSHVESVFTELRRLQPMERRTNYTLPARGVKTTGQNDDFLRRRTASEVRESGVSCGCGDYAAVFIELIRPHGYDALLVDAAQISLHSLANTFSGHAVVAIRPQAARDGGWWLVDSTARRVISRAWSPDATSFVASGSRYWIGYCGPIEKYPVRSPAELKAFYARTLATVPPEVFNETLVRLIFTVDRSLVKNEGGYLNPRIPRLAAEQGRIFEQYGITPEREVMIRLTRGGDDGRSDLNHVEGVWVSRLGLQSACSPSLLTYYEQRVRADEARP